MVILGRATNLPLLKAVLRLRNSHACHEPTKQATRIAQMLPIPSRSPTTNIPLHVEFPVMSACPSFHSISEASSRLETAVVDSNSGGRSNRNAPSPEGHSGHRFSHQCPRLRCSSLPMTHARGSSAMICLYCPLPAPRRCVAPAGRHADWRSLTIKQHRYAWYGVKSPSAVMQPEKKSTASRIFNQVIER